LLGLIPRRITQAKIISASLCGKDDYLVENDFNDNEDNDPVNDDGTVNDMEEGYEVKGGMILIKRKRPKII
jgi:hypothetical protein